MNRTSIEVKNQDKLDGFCTIEKLEEGEYFISDSGELCVRTEDIYHENMNEVYSNAICIQNGYAKIFSYQMLRLVKEVKIEYEL